jgi:putative transposase
MEKATTVVPFRQAESIEDPLTEIAREGARRAAAHGPRRAGIGTARARAGEGRRGGSRPLPRGG